MKLIKESNKVYLEDESQQIVAYITFPHLRNDCVLIDHTFVDPSLRGMGTANQLMTEVVSYLKEQNLTCVPQCSYAVQWFEKHPEFQALVEADGSNIKEQL